MSEQNEPLEGVTFEAPEDTNADAVESVSFESFLASFGENTEENATSTESEDSDSETHDDADNEADDDEPISFSDLDDDGKPDPVELITSKATDPEVKAALESLVSDFQNKETGFQKLHEQVTTVKEIAGVQSLNEVAKHYEEFVIPWSEVLANAASNDVATRDAAVKEIVRVACQSSGLSADELYGVVADLEAPDIKPSAAPTREEALKVLGLTDTALEELQTLKARDEFVAKYGKNISKVSERFGFTIDPAKIYEVKRLNPAIKDEAAILEAYPTEYKQYLKSKGSNIAGKREKATQAPSLGGKVASAPDKPFSEMSKEELLRMVTSAF